jgi:hypothetical protein
MNKGKTVFAQLMSMIPEYEFDKCVSRYKGNYRVRNFTCRDHFYVMSFTQLTRRESLRDIECCLNAFSNKLYHSGIKHLVPQNTTGVIKDELIKLTGINSSKFYTEPIRLVTYEDYATNNVYCFLTNNTEFPALTVSELYRERWNIELFFKWIKQHLHIKSFYGTSQNAVYCQIWIAICIFLLIAIAKKRMQIKQSLYTFAQTLGLSLFEKIPINEMFNKNIEPPKNECFYNLFCDSDF